MDKVAIGSVVLTKPRANHGLGAVATPWVPSRDTPTEVGTRKSTSTEIQYVKVTTDMLDWRSYRQSEGSRTLIGEVEDHYEEALRKLINAKRTQKPWPPSRTRGARTWDLMERAEEEHARRQPPRRASDPQGPAGQKEMLYRSKKGGADDQPVTVSVTRAV